MDLPYLNLYRSGGRVFAYYRRGGLRHRIHGQPGSPEFLAAYHEVHDRHAAPLAGRRDAPAIGSLSALIVAYRASPDWRSLKPSSRKDYEKALGPLHANHGHCPVATLERHHVRLMLERYSTKTIPAAGDQPARTIDTPRRANKIVTVLSVLMAYAREIGWRRGENPAARPKKLKVGKWRAWSDEELHTFLRVAPPCLRRACLLAVCTGQRGIDQVGMTWRSYDGTAIEVIAEKTDDGDGIAQWIPVHPILRAELDAATKTSVNILTRPDGKPWSSVATFQKAVSDAIREAGLVGVVWHGLRKTAARHLAEAGCSEREIMAITGHRTTAMVSLYTEQADQKRRANAAIEKFSSRWPGTEFEPKVTSQGMESD